MTNGTKNYYSTPSKPDRSTFGGNVYNYDFDGYNSISDITSRIISDWRFDEKCRKNGENYKRKQSQKKGNK